MSTLPMHLQVLACLARIIVLFSNYLFIYEALQSWIPVPLLKSQALRKSISSDAELIFLFSCAAYCCWEVLHTFDVAGSQSVALAVMVGVLIGTGALARAFGASLLIFALNSAQNDQTPEETKLRAMLNKWYVPPANGAPGSLQPAIKGKPAQQPTTNGSALHTSPQDYLAAAAVATRLMVPDSLPRALALRNLSSCGSVLDVLLKVARQVRHGSSTVDSSLVHLVSCLQFYTCHAEIQSRALPSEMLCGSQAVIAHQEVGTQ